MLALPLLVALSLAAAPGPTSPARDVPLPPPPDLRPSAKSLPPPPGARALRVAVPDSKVQGALPPRQLILVEEALLAELRKVEGVSAIGMGEIREMLSLEYQRQMMGCSDGEACLAEIGGALGTDEVLASTVVVEEKTVTFTLKRINMKGAKVIGSETRRLVRANGEELLGAIGPLIQAIYPERGLRAGRTRGVSKEVALRLNPPPLPRWVFIATASAAVLAVGAGAVYGSLSNDARQQYTDLAQSSVTSPVSGAQLHDLEATVSSRASTANLCFLAAGSLAVVAGVEVFFTDWHGYGASVDVAPGKAAIKVGGTF